MKIDEIAYYDEITEAVGKKYGSSDGSLSDDDVYTMIEDLYMAYYRLKVEKELNSVDYEEWN